MGIKTSSLHTAEQTALHKRQQQRQQIFHLLSLCLTLTRALIRSNLRAELRADRFHLSARVGEWRREGSLHCAVLLLASLLIS